MATIHATPRLPDLRDARSHRGGPPASTTGWDVPLQRVADVTVWLLFRLSGVRS